MPTSGDVLVVMAKYPTPGAVKTRLAQHVGAELASALYRAFLVDISARFTSTDWQLLWAVDPPGADLSAIVGTTAACIDQQGNDLGERMLHCFQTLFARGAHRVVMIGADAPHLSVSTLTAAFRALVQHDATFVPTRDGGYCLVGLRAVHDLFTGIPMGTDAVFWDTCQRAEALRLSVHVFEPYFDIDEPADIEMLTPLIDSGSVSLPATETVLAARRQGR